MIQQQLFEEIKKKIDPNLRLADVIGDLLGISSDSTYRRIRGDKELSLSELKLLCSHFNISMDYLFNHRVDSIPFNYSPLDFSSAQVYEMYMDRLARLYTGLATDKGNECKITAQDVPIFHFLPYTELTFFKVYALFRSLNNEVITYEAFVKKLNPDKLKVPYQTIVDSFLQIPSIEIWSDHTIEPILNLLEYYRDIGSFESKETALQLVNQLHDMVCDIEQKTQVAAKVYKGISTPFNFYLSPVDMQNDFIQMKGSTGTTTSIKLFTINAIFTADSAFNEETEKWINNTISKSMQLSGTSERERFRFFNQLKSKVQKLIQEFE
ncbi:helix-turn-helix domain-containing protein [Carboxylicivirga caseinilyticus]|uniref:helix-turn-helix domain-containing protein n=1 Tax=Carboxylicivirga caseinilyticus TaxID=3417572 RepID=UPI003D343CDB|nr:hypothetical protein [Marinilabiliaceae bacterium A049]